MLRRVTYGRQGSRSPDNRTVNSSHPMSCSATIYRGPGWPDALALVSCRARLAPFAGPRFNDLSAGLGEWGRLLDESLRRGGVIWGAGSLVGLTIWPSFKSCPLRRGRGGALG